MRLAAQLLRSGDHPVHPHLEQSARCPRRPAPRAVGAGRHHGPAQPGGGRRLQVAHRARVDLDAVGARSCCSRTVLAVAQAVDGLRAPAGRPGCPRAARCRGRRGTSGRRRRGPAVDVVVVVRARSRTVGTVRRRPWRAGGETRRTSASRRRCARGRSASAHRPDRRGRRSREQVGPARYESIHPAGPANPFRPSLRVSVRSQRPDHCHLRGRLADLGGDLDHDGEFRRAGRRPVPRSPRPPAGRVARWPAPGPWRVFR